MNIGMKVGNEAREAEFAPLAQAIVQIMEARADQKTIRHALTVLRDVAKIENVTVEGATIGDRKVTVNINADGDVATMTEGV